MAVTLSVSSERVVTSNIAISNIVKRNLPTQAVETIGEEHHVFSRSAALALVPHCGCHLIFTHPVSMCHGSVS